MIAEMTSPLEILKMQTDGLALGAAQIISVHGEEMGWVYEDAFAKYCRFAPILPADITLPCDAQAGQVFTSIQKVLEQHGFTVTDIVRTWFYLDDLLSWYSDFNRVRTAFFEKHGVFNHLIPASTAIGAGNPAGSALAAGLVAISPKDARTRIQAVASPLQGAAINYGSAFSRAVEVATPHERTLYISGTASIDYEGHSVHVGDARGQIQKTMEVVAALLKSRNMTWNDALRGVAYYPSASDHKHLIDYCRKQNLPELPLTVLESDVCRRELLFEIELETVAAGKSGS
jgi:enamine deaminase RidA (YjgF/YER057c/UK114 family)